MNITNVIVYLLCKKMHFGISKNAKNPLPTVFVQLSMGETDALCYSLYRLESADLLKDIFDNVSFFNAC